MYGQNIILFSTGAILLSFVLVPRVSDAAEGTVVDAIIIDG